ncbi:MAG: hypothetical protein A2V90_04405 [Gammaproteobacteria bacterium RBG_16_57_12]|nr:MAG: hypothetical protein A2V90_04405 [Gammaproteobacteria bacterium RBG_16_57_12]
MQIRSLKIAGYIPITIILLCQSAYGSSWDPGTKASNQGGIVNTRHNLTQSFLIFNGFLNMNPYRNYYSEVCVYCHTPHGANKQIDAPLWNHTISTTGFTPYTTQTGQAGTPGSGSLMCLSCHDGTLAVDSVINMPGSGGYNVSQELSQSNAFLNVWTNPSGPDAFNHFPLGQAVFSCAEFCHNPSGGLPDFRAFVVGKDLSNDHPVGVNYPAVGTPDFKIPANEKAGKAKFFGGDSTLNKNDVRLVYGSGEYRVECTSCHDPHGVPSAGEGSTFIGSFLRVDNAGSALCLTCHDK